MATAAGYVGLGIGPFLVDEDPLNTGKKFAKWIKKLERSMRLARISEPLLMVDALFQEGGDFLETISDVLPDLPTRSEADGGARNVYEAVRDKLLDHWTPKRNISHATMKFMSLQQMDGESTAQFVVRLREEAEYCDFGDVVAVDRRIREQILLNGNKDKLKRRAIENDWDLKIILKNAKLMEDSELQLKEMQERRLKQLHLSDISAENEESKKIRRYSHLNDHKKVSPETEEKLSSCNYCGYTHKHGKCPAFGKDCRKCGKKNHFANVCKSQKKEMKKVELVGSDSEEEILFTHCMSSEEKFQHVAMKVKIEGVEAWVEIDSCCSCTMMDEEMFRTIQEKAVKPIKLMKCKKKIQTYYGNNVPILGVFDTVVETKKQIVPDKVIVVKGNSNSRPLLGSHTALSLGILAIKREGHCFGNSPDTLGNFLEVNSPFPLHTKKMGIQSEGKHDTDDNEIILPACIEQYRHAFTTNIGKHRSINTKLHVDSSINPVAQTPRRIPFAYQERLSKHLSKLEQEGIIEDAPIDVPTTWVSNLVFVPKLKDPDPTAVRFCLDCRGGD